MNRAHLLLIGAFAAAALSVACSSPESNNPGSGGMGNTGGSTGNPDCPANMDDLIADFKTDNGIHPADGRSGGFYVYGDANGMFDPPAATSPYPIDATQGNIACSGAGSLRAKGTGFGVWGAALAADFVPKDGSYKGTYNATKYKGVGFFIKASAPLKGVQVSFPDVYTSGEANPSAIDPTIFPCQYKAGATNNCSPYLVKFGDAAAFPDYAAVTIDTNWKYVYVLFKDTKQDAGNQGYHRPNADYIDLEHLCSMAIQVNSDYSSGAVMPNNFELWVDDIKFLR
jgi:hypothetical protein